MDEERFRTILNTLYFQRKKDGIKNDFGKTLILGGSLPYPNAPLIAASSSLLSGNGFTALGVPEKIYPIVASRAEETIIYEPSLAPEYLVYTKENLTRMFSSYPAILFGNGIKDDESNLLLLKEILSSYHGNLILDATGLTLYGKLTEEERKKHASAFLLLTPHLGEARRLFSLTQGSRNPKDYEEIAEDFAKRYNVHILLKSVSSLYVTPEGKSFESSYEPTPSLGRAGSGDGLAGYIAGLFAYAAKLFTPDEIVLFADQFLHSLAHFAETKQGAGSLDIRSVESYFVPFLLSYKKESVR